MPVLSDEPGLAFWLRYAEREGALVEEQRDQALVLLPERLRDESELPEEAILTADPDIAREDGAVLLIAGHPAIDRAAASVLAEGDTGHAYVPWPLSRAPSRSALETRARELVPVDHGRIDASGEPAGAYLLLLRVGAMISYAASLTLRFQEQEEAWVDARTGLIPSGRLLAALRARRWLQVAEAHRRSLAANVPLALPAAHEQLQRRAIARQASLATAARRELESELARADAYYEGALGSIEHRLSTATDERARMLRAQADTIRLERARRHREIREQYTTRHEIKPFRLHVVHVPAFVLPVDVRRGSHTFPFALTWLAAVDEFAPVRCPACSAPERLVAGRDRLGCESCIPRAAADHGASSTTVRSVPAQSRTGVSPVPGPSSGTPGSDGTPPAGPVAREDAGAQAPVNGGVAAPVNGGAQAPVNRGAQAPVNGGAQAPVNRGAKVPVNGGAKAPVNRGAHAPVNRGATPVNGGAKAPVNRGARPSVSRSAPRPANRDAIERTGNKLALTFWETVAAGDRWPRGKAARDSPLRALYRLYGVAAPLCAIGIEPHQWPDEVIASTYPPDAGAPVLTLGKVVAGGQPYRFSLCWWIEAGKPVVGELMPAAHPLELPPARGEWVGTAARLRELAPAPTVELDPVAAALWRTEVERSGLPFAVRCLATWWRAQAHGDPAEPPEAIAAAVADAVAHAATMRRSRADSAGIYGTDPDALERAAHELQAVLRLDRVRGW